ncbi:hypothetical protein J3F83DRAFT_352689 [Trichoderma novae-zelandiae]
MYRYRRSYAGRVDSRANGQSQRPSQNPQKEPAAIHPSPNASGQVHVHARVLSAGFVLLQVTWDARLTACRPSRQGSTPVSERPSPQLTPLESFWHTKYTKPIHPRICALRGAGSGNFRVQVISHANVVRAPLVGKVGFPRS